MPPPAAELSAAERADAVLRRSRGEPEAAPATRPSIADAGLAAAVVWHPPPKHTRTRRQKSPQKSRPGHASLHAALPAPFLSASSRSAALPPMVLPHATNPVVALQEQADSFGTGLERKDREIHALRLELESQAIKLAHHQGSATEDELRGRLGAAEVALAQERDGRSAERARIVELELQAESSGARVEELEQRLMVKQLRGLAGRHTKGRDADGAGGPDAAVLAERLKSVRLFNGQMEGVIARRAQQWSGGPVDLGSAPSPADHKRFAEEKAAAREAAGKRAALQSEAERLAEDERRRELETLRSRAEAASKQLAHERAKSQEAEATQLQHQAALRVQTEEARIVKEEAGRALEDAQAEEQRRKALLREAQATMQTTLAKAKADEASNAAQAKHAEQERLGQLRGEMDAQRELLRVANLEQQSMKDHHEAQKKHLEATITEVNVNDQALTNRLRAETAKRIELEQAMLQLSAKAKSQSAQSAQSAQSPREPLPAALYSPRPTGLDTPAKQAKLDAMQIPASPDDGTSSSSSSSSEEDSDSESSSSPAKPRAKPSPSRPARTPADLKRMMSGER